MDRRRAAAPVSTGTVEQAAVPAVTVSSDLPVAAAERRFRLDSSLRGLVVRLPDGSAQLLTRGHLDAVLAGPYGYGRALHSRRAVSEVLFAGTLVLPGHLTMRSAAEVVLRRDAASRYDDVVVALTGGGYGLLPVTVLFEDLSRTFSVLALHDGLTGLPNRWSLEQRVADVPVRPGAALLYLDLDGFKAVNDAHGHRAGDELLRGVADRLRECVRPQDLVVRLGGDEFAILLETVTPQEAHAVAERVVQRIALPFELGSARVRVGSSVGLVLHDEPAELDAVVEVDELLRCADAAMYEAKREGRGRWVSRKLSDDVALPRHPDLRARLTRAIEGGVTSSPGSSPSSTWPAGRPPASRRSLGGRTRGAERYRRTSSSRSPRPPG